MRKQLLVFILTVFSNISFAQQNTDAPPLAKPRPADYEYLSAPDSTGNRHNLKMPQEINESSRSLHAQLPYPIIFIHGLNSSSETWDTMANFVDAHYGMVYGGRFDYCLNYDGHYTNPNLNFWPTAGADLAFFTNTADTIINGDYYYVNFNVDTDGSVFSTSVESNQAAVYKQGLAVKWAIYQVLQITGKDKVILMGHSMGGLASRQYLQNPNTWQPDGQHHVAKLVTTGTPHAGSNASIGSFLDGILTGIDDQSEAVRDLRTSYYYSDSLGVYLFGGYESNTTLNDELCCYFYNNDVNCDGTTGHSIAGLDQKNLYTDLDYSCIIGECTSCLFGEELPGDGIVNDVSANLSDFYNGVAINLFYYYASAATQIHSDLPKQIIQNLQGLDEPDKYNLAYHIGFDNTYLGFTTTQDTDDINYPVDFDLFRFGVPVSSNVTVSISNISLPNLFVNIVDTGYHVIGSGFQSNGSAAINFTQTLNAGDYFLNIYGTETAVNYIDPYHFILTKTIATGINELSESDVQIYPNPTSNELIIQTVNFQPQLISIYDVNGRKVLEEKYEPKVNVSPLNTGMYFIELKAENGIVRKKFIKL